MTTIEDLGEVTCTTTEWTNRIHYVDGDPKEGDPMTRDSAQFAGECVQLAIAGFAAGEQAPSWVTRTPVAVDLVSRTVTDYASGHVLYGPWEVTE